MDSKAVHESKAVREEQEGFSQPSPEPVYSPYDYPADYAGRSFPLPISPHPIGQRLGDFHRASPYPSDGLYSWHAQQDAASSGLPPLHTISSHLPYPTPYAHASEHSYSPRQSDLNYPTPLASFYQESEWSRPVHRSSDDQRQASTSTSETLMPIIPLAVADRVKPFISILYLILSDPDHYSDCISWDESGTSFILSHTDRLLHDVLPRHFHHSSLQAFTRQLNVYEFTRMTTRDHLEHRHLAFPPHTTNYSGWSHASFVRDEQSLLGSMKPRPSKARLMKKEEKSMRASQGAGRRKSMSEASGK